MAAVSDRPSTKITQLQNYSLPAVGCEPNFKQCELRCFPCQHEEGENLCCTLPVLNSTGGNGLAFLQLRRANEQEYSSPIWLQNQTIGVRNWDCVMGHTFDRKDGNRVISCFNTSIDSAYIVFVYLIHDTSTLQFSVQQYTSFENFPGPLALSETRYLSESNGDCQYKENVFFVSISEAYTTNINGDNEVIIPQSGTISDCWYPIDVAFIETNLHLLLRVQCSQHITKLVTACGSHRTVEVYDSRINGTLCQCSVLDTDTRVLVNVTLRDDLICFTATGDLPIFENISRSHPFSFTPNISYSFCHIESDLTFVFGLSNGSVFSFSFTTGKTSILARNSCNSSTDSYARGECYKTHLYNSSSVVLAYDHVDSSFVVANLSCLEDPVVARIVVYPLPPLDELVRGPGGSCPSHPLSASSTVSPSASPVLSTPTTETTVHPNKNVSSTITYPTSTPTTKAVDQLLIALLVGAVLSVSIIGIIAAIVFILCIRHRRRKARSMAVNSQQLIPKKCGTNGAHANTTEDTELRQLSQSNNSSLPRDSSPSSDSSSSSPNSKEYSAESDPATTDPTKSTSVEPDSATPYPMTSSSVGGATISGNEASGEVNGQLPVVSSEHNTEDSSHSRELLFTSTPDTVSGDDDDQPKPKPPGAVADAGFQSQPLPSSETATQLQTTNVESAHMDDRQQSLLGRPQSLTWEQPSDSGGATFSNNSGRMDLAFPYSPASPGHSSRSEPPSPSPSHRLSQYVSGSSPVVPPTPASNTPGNTAPVIGQGLPLVSGFVQQPPNPHSQQQIPGQQNPGHQQPPNPHLQPQNPGQPQPGQNPVVDPETGQKGKNNL